MNIQIRQAIQSYISTNGPSDSRIVINQLAQQFNTTKQRISGNISYMVCRAGTLQIHRNSLTA